MATLHSRMFIAQATLERWVDSGNVDIQNNVVVLRNHNRAYVLEPAVRFVSVLEGAAPQLVGKVLTEIRIVELGGELLGDSVLFGDAAFQVESGYVGTLKDR